MTMRDIKARAASEGLPFSLVEIGFNEKRASYPRLFNQISAGFVPRSLLRSEYSFACGVLVASE